MRRTFLLVLLFGLFGCSSPEVMDVAQLRSRHLGFGGDGGARVVVRGDVALGAHEPVYGIRDDEVGAELASFVLRDGSGAEHFWHDPADPATRPIPGERVTVHAEIRTARTLPMGGTSSGYAFVTRLERHFHVADSTGTLEQVFFPALEESASGAGVEVVRADGEACRFGDWTFRYEYEEEIGRGFATRKSNESPWLQVRDADGSLARVRGRDLREIRFVPEFDPLARGIVGIDRIELWLRDGTVRTLEPALRPSLEGIARVAASNVRKAQVLLSGSGDCDRVFLNARYDDASMPVRVVFH